MLDEGDLIEKRKLTRIVFPIMLVGDRVFICVSTPNPKKTIGGRSVFSVLKDVTKSGDAPSEDNPSDQIFASFTVPACPVCRENGTASECTHLQFNPPWKGNDGLGAIIYQAIGCEDDHKTENMAFSGEAEHDQTAVYSEINVRAMTKLKSPLNPITGTGFEVPLLIVSYDPAGGGMHSNDAIVIIALSTHSNYEIVLGADPCLECHTMLEPRMFVNACIDMLLSKARYANALVFFVPENRPGQTAASCSNFFDHRGANHSQKFLIASENNSSTSGVKYGVRKTWAFTEACANYLEITMAQRRLCYSDDFVTLPYDFTTMFRIYTTQYKNSCLPDQKIIAQQFHPWAMRNYRKYMVDGDVVPSDKTHFSSSRVSIRQFKETLETQLLAMKYVVKNNGKSVSISGKEHGQHDDLVVALSMGLYVLFLFLHKPKKAHYAPFRERVLEKLATLNDRLNRSLRAHQQ